MLLCVLELELGEVAGFVELGLGVVSLCAQAPKTIANTKGNAKESTCFIVGPPNVAFERRFDGLAWKAVYRSPNSAFPSPTIRLILFDEDGMYGMDNPGV